MYERELYEYQYWQHRQSGESFAVLVIDGKPAYINGPLHYEEIAQNQPSEYNFDDEFNGNPDDYILTGDDR